MAQGELAGLDIARPSHVDPYSRCRFRIDKATHVERRLESPHLFATFTPPGVKLTNSSKEVFIYETKGPYSDWSTTRYTLEPGKSHEFDIAYPLTYRRNNEVYTLYPGSHSEFREPITGGPPKLFKAREETPKEPPAS